MQSLSSFSAGRATRHFHTFFKAERAAFLLHIRGFATESERERFASLLLNRLMFLYFVQKKGLLAGDVNYLWTQLRLMQAREGQDTFYQQCLLRLFSPQSPTACHSSAHVPSFVGGLFFSQPPPSVQIDDAAFERLFLFFDRYRWHLDERPLQHVREITPSLLGHLFERGVTQQQMGAYYTRIDVSEYIAKYTIIPYLLEAIERECPSPHYAACWRLLAADPDRYIHASIRIDTQLPAETPREYASRRARYTQLRARLLAGEVRCVDDLITCNLDICRFALDALRALEDPALLLSSYQQLTRLAILDPTCGSGAFLFAALSVLAPLYEACLERMQAMADREDAFREILEAVRSSPNLRYFVLKTIMQHNLYGVDMMEEASELCRLRLLLKLLTTVEAVEDIGRDEALSTMVRNIRVGNALVGFTPPGPHLAPSADLDHELAREYAIDPADPQAFAQWRESHRPFHWCSEFAQVFRHGGFDVIIGNPPYVEYSRWSFGYTLRNFSTLPCANLYTCVVERSRQLLSTWGRQGMILPLAAFATRNMIPFIEGFRNWFPTSWLSFYHFRPAMLFAGGKSASIPTAIFLARVAGPERRWSTHVVKWASELRDQVFARLFYCQVAVPRDPVNRHYYPKFGSPIENAILRKVLPHPPVSTYLADAAGPNRMFYRSAGGLYWKVFVNFAWPYETTSNKYCTFREGYDRDVFVALFNSSLFWWYYTVTFDTFNVKDYMLFGFRFPYPDDQDVINDLRALCRQLMADFRRNARHLKRGETGSYTIYAKKSKAILDGIDRVLARLYGFSAEELDFLLHYDIAYRMGGEQTP